MPALWHWASRGAYGEREMTRILTAAGLDISPRAVRLHFGRHGQAQPAPLGMISRKRAHATVRLLEPRLRTILDLVWRLRCVSTRLVASLYYEDEGEGALNHASADLNDLARANMLHRFHPPKPLEGHGGRRRELWFLGREAIPWLEERYAISIGAQHYVTSERQIGTLMLNHDMTINRLLDQLRVRGRREGVLAPDGHRVHVDMPPANWYGARHLGLGYLDRATSVRRTLISDGFAAVSGRAFEPRKGYPASWLCPFFFEFDRGGREAKEVVAQLISYHWLGLDRAAGKRFPDLDVPGYVTPMLMVFRQRGRLVRIANRVRAWAAQQNITRGAPMLLVVQEDLEAGGWDEPTTMFMWDPDPKRRWPLYHLLERLSAPLITSGRVSAKVPLRLDPAGAARVSTVPSEESRRRARLAKKQAALAAGPTAPALDPARAPGGSSAGAVGDRGGGGDAQRGVA